ncbi:MAG: DUF4349 domain-containing protein [Gilvibacter sp.]
MKIISAILLFGIVLSCNDNLVSESKDYANADMDGYFEEEALEDAAMIYDGDQRNIPPKPEAEVVEKKIIKTATIQFETRDLEATHKRVLSLVNQNKAYLQNDNSGKQYSKAYRQLIIRVPTQNFQALVDSIGVGVAYFDKKDISRKDVGEEFVDLQARLKAKRVLEDRYLQLLSKAKNVKEMLEIERELSSIREEIEAKQGRLNYLQNQVSLSTIYLEFYKTDVETIATQSYGAKMGNAIKGGWNGITSFFLGLLYIWPFILILGLVVFFIRRYLKRRKKVAS